MFNPLDFIPKSLLGVLVLALLTTNIYVGFENGKLKIEVSRAATKLAEADAAHLQAVATAQSEASATAAKYRAKEQALQVALDTQRKSSNETIAQLASQRDTLKLWLASANPTDSTRASSATSVARVAAATTRGDVTLVPSEVGSLIDEAFRADQIRVELLGCYAAYDNARSALQAAPKTQ